jgi:hypothetical protein
MRTVWIFLPCARTRICATRSYGINANHFLYRLQRRLVSLSLSADHFPGDRVLAFSNWISRLHDDVADFQFVFPLSTILIEIRIRESIFSMNMTPSQDAGNDWRALSKKIVDIGCNTIRRSHLERNNPHETNTDLLYSGYDCPAHCRLRQE